MTSHIDKPHVAGVVIGVVDAGCGCGSRRGSAPSEFAMQSSCRCLLTSARVVPGAGWDHSARPAAIGGSEGWVANLARDAKLYSPPIEQCLCYARDMLVEASFLPRVSGPSTETLSGTFCEEGRRAETIGGFSIAVPAQ